MEHRHMLSAVGSPTPPDDSASLLMQIYDVSCPLPAPPASPVLHGLCSPTGQLTRYSHSTHASFSSSLLFRPV